MKKAIVFSLIGMFVPLLHAGITPKSVEVFPEKISLGDAIEVSGSFSSPDAVDAVVVLSQTQTDFFRKKAKEGAGLEKTGPGEYTFSVKLSTRIKGVPVDTGEHILRMVALDATGGIIDNVVLCKITVHEPDETPQAANSVLEQDYSEIQRIAAETKLPDYYTDKDLLADNEKPDWLNSDAGQADVVLPPWTPVGVDGMKISVWNRTYTLGAGGLPADILTGGHPLLQAPVRYVLRVDGKEFNGPYESRVLEKKDTGVTLVFKAQAGGVQIRTEVSAEYDGLCQFETRLTPLDGPVSVDEFLLEIPVRADRVEHYTHSTLGTFQPQKKDNPDLYILSLGDSGAIVPGSKVIPWTPQLSLVGPESGICIGFLNDKDWKRVSDDQMIEINSENETVAVRAWLVAKQTKLTEPLKYEWYLQALPARPVLPWDEYTQFHSHQKKNAEAYLEHFQEVDGVAPIDKAIAEGLKTIIVHQDWTELQGHMRTYQPERARMLREVVDAAHKRGLKVVLYAGTELSAASPEWKQYADKILKIPLWGGRPRGEPKAVSYRPCSNRYYNDMLVHRMREAIQKYDIDGVFLDGHPNMGLCMNTNHGHGYVQDNGQVAGTSYALDSRDLMRRIYTLFKYECKKDGLVIGHGGLYTPSFGFMDINLVGETEVYARKINPSLKLQELMSLDHFESSYSPATYGVLPLWMSKSYHGGLTYDENTAVTLAFGVMPRVAYAEVKTGSWDPAFEKFVELSRRSHNVWKLFRAFKPVDGDLVSYREIPAYCTVNPEMDALHIVSMHLVKGDRALVIASNLSEDSEKAELSLNLNAMGFTGKVEATDPETGEEIDLSNGKLTVKVSGGNYRLIRIDNVQR